MKMVTRAWVEGGATHKHIHIHPHTRALRKNIFNYNFSRHFLSDLLITSEQDTTIQKFITRFVGKSCTYLVRFNCWDEKRP